MPSVHPSKSSADPTDTILVTDASGNIFNVPASALGGQSTGGYVAPPVYSNSSGEAGQYSWDADYFYICIAEDSWDRFPVSREGWNTMMPENPTILSLAINDDGDVLTIVFDRVVSMGSAYQNSDINLDASSTGDDIGVSYVSGSGSSTWVFSISEAIRGGEAVNLDYNGRPDGIEDDVGGDLQAISSREVENGSLSGYSDIILWDGFEGLITGTTYEATNYDYPPFHAAIVGSGVILSTSMFRVGGKSLVFAGQPYGYGYKFSPVVPQVRGRVGAWFKMADIGYDQPFISATINDTSTDRLTIYSSGTNTSNGIHVLFTLLGTVRINTVVPITLGRNTWFFLEISWDFSDFGVRVGVDGSEGITIPLTVAADGNWTDLHIGSYSGFETGFYGYVDNAIYTTDPNRDLYALALLETCPRTG